MLGQDPPSPGNQSNPHQAWIKIEYQDRTLTILFRCNNLAIGGGVASEVRVDRVEIRKWPSPFVCSTLWASFDHDRLVSIEPEPGEEQIQLETGSVVVGQGGGFTGGVRFDIPRNQRFEDVLGDHPIPIRVHSRNLVKGRWTPQGADFNLQVTVIRGGAAAIVRTLVDGKYTVQAGDNLWNIAEEFLGSGALCTAIIEANSEAYSGLLDNPNLIQPGWELVIPTN